MSSTDINVLVHLYSIQVLGLPSKMPSVHHSTITSLAEQGYLELKPMSKPKLTNKAISYITSIS